MPPLLKGLQNPAGFDNAKGPLYLAGSVMPPIKKTSDSTYTILFLKVPKNPAGFGNAKKPLSQHHKNF